MGIRRSLNRCGSCGHTWNPKGKSLSSNCPHCNSTDTRYDIKKPKEEEEERDQREQASVFGSGLSEPPPVFGAPPSFGGPPRSQPAPRSSSRQAKSPQARSKPGDNAKAALILLLVLAGLGGAFWFAGGKGVVEGWLGKKGILSSPRQRPKAAPVATGCRAIERRLRYARAMARKKPKKWSRWVRHWSQKWKREGCP